MKHLNLRCCPLLSQERLASLRYGCCDEIVWGKERAAAPSGGDGVATAPSGFSGWTPQLLRDRFKQAPIGGGLESLAKWRGFRGVPADAAAAFIASSRPFVRVTFASSASASGCGAILAGRQGLSPFSGGIGSSESGGFHGGSGGGNHSADGGASLWRGSESFSDSPTPLPPIARVISDTPYLGASTPISAVSACPPLFMFTVDEDGNVGACKHFADAAGARATRPSSDLTPAFS